VIDDSIDLQEDCDVVLDDDELSTEVEAVTVEIVEHARDGEPFERRVLPMLLYLSSQPILMMSAPQ